MVSYMLGMRALLPAADAVLGSIAGSVTGQPASGVGSTGGGGNTGADASTSTGRACPEAGQQGLVQQLQVVMQQLGQAMAPVLPAEERNAKQLQPLLEPAARLAVLVEAL